MIKNAFVVLTPTQINMFLMKIKTRAETCWMVSGVPLPFSLSITCSRITAMQTSDLGILNILGLAYGAEGDWYARDKKINSRNCRIKVAWNEKVKKLML